MCLASALHSIDFFPLACTIQFLSSFSKEQYLGSSEWSPAFLNLYVASKVYLCALWQAGQVLPRGVVSICQNTLITMIEEVKLDIPLTPQDLHEGCGWQPRKMAAAWESSRSISHIQATCRAETDGRLAGWLLLFFPSLTGHPASSPQKTKRWLFNMMQVSTILLPAL